MLRRTMMVCACVVCLWWSGPIWGQDPDAVWQEVPDVEEVEGLEPIELPSDFDSIDCGECDSAGRCCCECPVGTIAHGEISGYHLGDPGFRGARLVIRTPGAWTRFWGQHASHLDPPPPPPPVDFERSVVLAAVQGLRSSGGGPAIEFKGVLRCGETTTAHIVVRNRRGPLDVVTNPFHIVQIPVACAPCMNAVAFVWHRPRVVPGAVVGQVEATDDPNTPPEPLPGAHVQLVRPDSESEPVAETMTDEEGLYHMDGILPGVYTVIAAAEGYAPSAAPVAVFPGLPAHRDLVLMPPPPPPGDEPADDE